MSPAAPEKTAAEVYDFKGIDLTSAAPVVSLSRSPYAPNMVRDAPGKVRKRMGYKKLADYGGRINGVHYYTAAAGRVSLIHAGTSLYREDGSLICGGMADSRSTAFELCGALYIADGCRLMRFDGSTAAAASDSAYRPTLTIGRKPSGGGTDYEAPNLLTGGFRELFEADGTSRVFQLSMTGLDSDQVVVKKMNAAGEFVDFTSHFTVNRALGTVTFSSPPPLPEKAGTSNIEISAQKTVQGYAERINGCTTGAIFGVNGNQDRLFLSGNAKWPNLDFHSEIDKPTYFPDTAYTRLGQDGSVVMGYIAFGERLLTFKDKDADSRSVAVRSGIMDDGRAVFPIENLLTGAGAASKYCFAEVGGEPLFLSHGGVFAITRQEQTAVEYTQNRSYYINRELCGEQGLENAVAASYNNFYMIAINQRIYLLDTLRKEYQRNAPYSSFQYECYLFTDIAARVLYTEGGRLRFGTEDGGIFEFYADADDPNSFNDCGKPIAACWTTPDFSGDTFYRYKDIMTIAVKMQPAAVTSIRVLAKVRGVFRDISSERALCRYLKFSAIRFSILNFSCDTDPRVLVTRPKLKKTACSSIRFENGGLNEPFSILELGIIYRKTGFIRGTNEKN